MKFLLNKLFKKKEEKKKSVLMELFENPDNFLIEGKIVDGEIILKIRKNEEST